ncbi:MAG: threonine synthase [Gemmatimonadetes bacterium]|jgi:threonine synthase|nr:threonine synthase [Gemmatimonadota bacterium]MBT4613294.1 threonine synthase [Gemmatimonadota bacterium]MBT5056644.1 threonine synthase [Gemmatimonadota bacterium]MBT5141929.1 threonine synthase [Gemmatimonadota bacterium]MBT5589781.1 threonine synthase [Gemmatimonadota bacterium]
MTTYRSWFECIRCGSERYALNEVVYECSSCGGLLEVQHDLDALGERPAEQWRQLFDQRYMGNTWPYGSGVWGKKEMVCPTVDEDNVVSMYEGGSNLFWAERFGSQIGLEDLWIKQCGNSHTGSFKDLGMTVLVSMVKQMRAEGKQIPAIACASTGDTSAALGAYGAAAGIPVIVFLPKDKISLAQLIQPIANGALTLSIRTDFDGCMKLVQELCREEDIYLANSMNSLRIEGQKTVGIEMVQQFDWHVPDWIVIPGGNLGNVSALGKGFLEMQAMGIIDRLPGIVVAQAQRANPLYRSFQNEFETFEPMLAGDTLASAIRIGDPVSYERAVRVIKRFDGVVEQASEHELADACARADRTGLFSCPHTGVALAALLKLIDRGTITSAQKVVVISTAHGLKFPEFKVRYHEDQLRESHEVNPMHSNQPVEVDPDYDQVRSAIFRNLEAVQA